MKKMFASIICAAIFTMAAEGVTCNESAPIQSVQEKKLNVQRSIDGGLLVGSDFQKAQCGMSASVSKKIEEDMQAEEDMRTAEDMQAEEDMRTAEDVKPANVDKGIMLNCKKSVDGALESSNAGADSPKEMPAEFYSEKAKSKKSDSESGKLEKTKTEDVILTEQDSAGVLTVTPDDACVPAPDMGNVPTSTGTPVTAESPIAENLDVSLPEAASNLNPDIISKDASMPESTNQTQDASMPVSLNPADEGENNVPNMKNPFIDCKTLEEAGNVAGFQFQSPKSINGYGKKRIFAVEGDLVQVIYGSGRKSFFVRKTIKERDISGDYHVYDKVGAVKINGFQVVIKGTGKKANAAIWTDGEFSYSVSTQSAVGKTKMKKIVQKVMRTDAGNQGAGSNVQIANPFVDCKDMQEAAGFRDLLWRRRR